MGKSMVKLLEVRYILLITFIIFEILTNCCHSEKGVRVIQLMVHFLYIHVMPLSTIFQLYHDGQFY